MTYEYIHTFSLNNEMTYGIHTSPSIMKWPLTVYTLSS